MDFIDELRAFAKNIPQLSEKILTEEGTKNALVMPFIKILGYDVFNPNEVNPEYIADVPTKKDEKVDYAIMKDGEPILLIECKPVNTVLSQVQGSQLYRYFSVTTAKVGVLTNGVVYQFFTDLENKNKMDEKPFLEIDLLDIKEPHIQELKKFTKQGLDLDQLTDTASQLKYTYGIKQIMNSEFQKPSEEFVKFFARQVYKKLLNQQAKEKFTKITKEALNQFLTDKINDKLKVAMESEGEVTPIKTGVEVSQEKTEPTKEEWEGYYIVKAILTEVIDPARVYMRDAKSYCPILLDDNNKKTICRFYFGPKQKYVGVFDNVEKTETKIPIDNLNELFLMADHFKKMVGMMTEETKKKSTVGN